MSRYHLTDAAVVLELTAQQAAITLLVLKRAQEDREFFAELAGGADPRYVNVLRMGLAQVINKLEEK